MRRRISWTNRMADGVKREVRVTLDSHGAKWQFKRADQERWDYDSSPTADDWDALENILTRRGQRGRQIGLLERVRKMRPGKGA